MTIPRPVLIYGGAVLVLVGIGYFAARKVAAKIPPKAFNPLSPDNLAYQGVNEVGKTITGNPHWTLGVAWWETFNNEPDLTAPTGPGAKPAAPGQGDSWPDAERSPFNYGA